MLPAAGLGRCLVHDSLQYLTEAFFIGAFIGSEESPALSTVRRRWNGATLQRGQRHFAVALDEVRVGRVEQRPIDLNRQVKRRPHGKTRFV